MMLPKRKYSILLVLLVLAALTGTACKESAEQLNQTGNDRFAEEAYLEALHAYNSAQLESPELAEPYYNAANALYREGAYEDALALLEMALQVAQMDENEVQSLVENSFYNLGNTSFNQESWEAAIAAYREALLRNPDDLDAKYNLELALQQLQEQQQNEEEQQQEQQNEDEQEQEQEQSENGEDQENEEEQSQDQSQDGENGDENEQENSESDAGNEGEQEQNQQNQSQNGQEQGEEGNSPSTVPPSGQGMTAEQAEQLLAAIAAESDTLQEELGEIYTVPAPPPVQDW